MKYMPTRTLLVGSIPILVFVLVIVFLLIPPLVNVSYVTTIFISALLFGVLGAIYDFMIGFAGLSNFGFAGFFAVGAYTSGLAAYHYGLDPWLGLPLGGLMTTLVGLFTGVIALRLRGLYLGLMTWFVAEAIRNSISNATDYTRGVLGLAVPPFPDLAGIHFSHSDNPLSYYFLLLVLAFAIMAIMSLVVRSRVGLAFKAFREDQLATESLGLNTTKYKLLNFTIASFFIGVLGAFYAHYLGILTPTPEEFGVPRTVEVLTIAYVGGRGTLWGSVVAAFLIIGFQEYFRSLGAYRLLLFGLLLIVIMIFAPKGLAGLRNVLIPRKALKT